MWVLALGASLGYLAFKRQAIESRLDLAVQEWEGAGAKPSEPSPPSGANYSEIKQAWKYTEDTKNRHFNERLPANERAAYLAAEREQEQVALEFDRQAGPTPSANIEGVYLEQSVPF